MQKHKMNKVINTLHNIVASILKFVKNVFIWLFSVTIALVLVVMAVNYIVNPVKDFLTPDHKKKSYLKLSYVKGEKAKEIYEFSIKNAKNLNVDEENVVDGDLVFYQSSITYDNKIHDDFFKIDVDEPIIIRVVETLQWSKSGKSYIKKWSSKYIDSDGFSDLYNINREIFNSKPATEVFMSNDIRLGKYNLTDEQFRKVFGFKKIHSDRFNKRIKGVVSRINPKKIDKYLKNFTRVGIDVIAHKASSKVVDGKLYVGDNSSSPTIGDKRVHFYKLRFDSVSLVAGKTGDLFHSYYLGNERINHIGQGKLSISELFELKTGQAIQSSKL